MRNKEGKVRLLRGGGSTKNKSKLGSPQTQTKIWKYLNKKIRNTEKEEIKANPNEPSGPSDLQGSPKEKLDRPEEAASGIKIYKQQGGSNTDPPLGKRNKSSLITTSNSGENLCQEGGTDRGREALTSEKPPIRESTRGSNREGREKRSKGKTKDMAKAMEKWLKSGEAATRLVKGPKEEK